MKPTNEELERFALNAALAEACARLASDGEGAGEQTFQRDVDDILRWIVRHQSGTPATGHTLELETPVVLFGRTVKLKTAPRDGKAPIAALLRMARLVGKSNFQYLCFQFQPGVGAFEIAAKERRDASFEQRQQIVQFGNRVLEIETAGTKRQDALNQAAVELGIVRSERMLQYRFGEFVKIASRAGYVPHPFDGIGGLPRIRHALQSLQGKRGPARKPR